LITGDYAKNSGSLYVELEGILNYIPALQGPFIIIKSPVQENGGTEGGLLNILDQEPKDSNEKKHRRRLEVRVRVTIADGSFLILNLTLTSQL
jgi:hypothetical protein